MEEVDWQSLHKILGDTTRRNIMQVLAEKEALSYTEIMVLLQITNTGRLNYHLKALKTLISKNDQGKYHLTDKGKLAVNLLRAFPDKVPVEKQQHSALRIAVVAVLLLSGALLIASGTFLLVTFPAATTAANSIHASVQNQVIPMNTTVSLTSCDIPTDASPLTIDWSASSPIYIYVMNSTQHDALLLQHAKDGQAPSTLANFSGAPQSWVNQYYLQTGSLALNLPPGQYYFLAASNVQATLDIFSLRQSPPATSISTPSPSMYLLGLAPIAVGILIIALAVLILTRRVWR
jgi:hypothetical protein